MPLKVKIYKVDGTEIECWGPAADETVKAYPEVWAKQPWPETKPVPAPETPPAQASGKAEGVSEDKQQPPTQQPSNLPPEATGKVVVPSDWDSLTFFAKQEIAQQIIGKQDRTLKKAAVEQIITDYLATP